MNYKRVLLVLGLALCLSLALAQTARREKPFGGTASAQTSSRADSLTGFDVQRYELTLAINQQTHQISGNVLATVLAEANLTTLPYNLQGLTVSSVLVNGTAAPYTHSNGIINISLNIPSGQTFTTQVFYSGVPSLSPDVYHIGMIFSANTVFTISDPDAARYWWPCYDHPWDKAIVDLHITLRSDWKVAANGIRTGIVDNGDGTSTTHWMGAHPMTTYLACITCGPYQEINQTAGAIPIQNFVMQNQYNAALVDFANLPDMVDYFSQVFGPYPFEKYGNAAVSMSTYGAMEHQTMTTLGNYIITGTGAYELTIAHELAHQWYGNAVSFLTFKDVWLSEGFATYSEHLWVDHTEGWQAAADYVGSAYHQYYLNWEGSNPRTIYDPSFNNYFAPPSYEKAASVLHMLRLKIGNSNFFQLLHDWFTAWQGGNVVTAEFQALAEQISGLDLDQFFQQWIYSPGIPELRYSVWNNDASDSPLKIIAQTVSNTATPFQVEVPFRFVDDALTDSLVVSASPQGEVNHFWHSFTANSALTPNFNHWALLRNVTELQPSLSACLPSNNAVLLDWTAFLNDPALRYNVYRSPQSGTPQWLLLNPEPMDALTFTDLTAQNGTAYRYAIRAVDSGGWESMPSNVMDATPVSFSFANGLLVVDETRDGNGANINPTDLMVDSFYAAALDPLEFQAWDCAADGMPGLDVLGQYRLLLWHADDFTQNLLQDNLNVLGGYLLGGGKVLLSGWKTPAALSASFLQRFAGNVGLVYDNTPCLISAQSALYPQLVVDPLKLLGNWNGMLPYIYTFTGAANPIYSATLSPSSPGNGNCGAFQYQEPGGSSALVLFGFPLYFMQAEGVRGFLQAIVPELLSGVASQDPVSPAVVPSLRVSPNPFRQTSSLDISLPAKGFARLAIYNLKGQHVRQILASEQNPGSQILMFDGRDDRSKELPSGIYIIKLEQGGHSLIRKICLLK